MKPFIEFASFIVPATNAGLSVRVVENFPDITFDCPTSLEVKFELLSGLSKDGVEIITAKPDKKLCAAEANDLSSYSKICFYLDCRTPQMRFFKKEKKIALFLNLDI
jgi:hypothetical protein